MEFEFVKHDELSTSSLDEIISIKGSVWNYPIESHKDWISKNIRPGDYHLIVRNSDKCVAYLNLVDLIVTAQQNDFDAWGIGNVCVRPEFQGKNYGLLLLKLVDFFLASTHRAGVLICRDHVALFYERCNWHKFSGTVIDPDSSDLMYNLFFSQGANLPNYNSIRISRIF